MAEALRTDYTHYACLVYKLGVDGPITTRIAVPYQSSDKAEEVLGLAKDDMIAHGYSADESDPFMLTRDGDETVVFLHVSSRPTLNGVEMNY